MTIKRMWNVLMKYMSDKNYRFLLNACMGWYDNMPDEEYLKRKFRAIMGYELDIDNPLTLNEKLQWIKLNDRNPKYTIMADKYEAREYVANQTNKVHFVPLLGVWDDVDEINFNEMPDKYVLKLNHNSGLGMCICRDKQSLNYNDVKKELSRGLNQDYYLGCREWPYKNIKRKIICEKYIESENNSGITDYKFFCFNGEPKFINVSTGLEDHKKAAMCFLDLEWNLLEIKRTDFQEYEEIPSKPKCLKEMISVAKELSYNIPFIRVDLYEIDNEIYFSELTFFPAGGFIPFEDNKYDQELGKLLKLPKKD